MFPFSFHWYDGVAPPFVGTAVNVTLVPEQIVLPGLAAILTDGATAAVTVIVISLDVAAIGLTHAREDVITQVTLAPLINAAF